jgi:hypothetical protein
MKVVLHCQTPALKVPRFSFQILRLALKDKIQIPRALSQAHITKLTRSISLSYEQKDERGILLPWG